MALKCVMRNFTILPKHILGPRLTNCNYGNYRIFSTSRPLPNKKQIEVTFLRANGERLKVKANIGDTLLDVVVNNNVDLEGFGACEGTLTCSTCHLIFTKDDYEQLPDKPTDEELDMLDLAFDLSDTSRLGCQIILTEGMNGLEVKVPASIHDVRSE